MSDWSIKYEGLISSVGISFPEENFINLKSVHGLRLATFRFHHPHPKALVFIFHGLHISSYDFSHVGKALYENGFDALAFDQEGHGKSEGVKGVASSLEDYSLDCEKFIVGARELYPSGIPIFCLGLSMGGTLCILTALRIPNIIKGIILLAPSLGVNPDFEPFLQKLVLCLNACCCGKLKVKALDPELLSRNQNFAGYLSENPEFYSGKISVRTAALMINGFNRLQPQLPNVHNSILLFHGGQDKVVSLQQSKDFITNSKSTDKKIIIYPEMFHAVTHEPELEIILSKTISWLNKRV